MTRETPRKQELAQRLVEQASPMALLWQVGCEFIARHGEIDGLKLIDPFGI